MLYTGSKIVCPYAEEIEKTCTNRIYFLFVYFLTYSFISFCSYLKTIEHIKYFIQRCFCQSSKLVFYMYELSNAFTNIRVRGEK